MLNTLKWGVSVVALSLVVAGTAQAKSALEIDSQSRAALEQLRKDVPDSRAMIDKASGVLIFPKVTKAGLGVGGEYGEGALIVKGKTVNYYSTAAASIGLQIGAQTKSVAILFMNDEALRKFEQSSGWEVGVDGSVALMNSGSSGKVDTTTTGQPILGYIFGESGLMADVSLQGSKFSKLEKTS